MKRAQAEQRSTTDTPSAVRGVVAAALDRKAVDLRVLRLEEVSDFTDYFLICSGDSRRQVQAIADAVEKRLRSEARRRPLHVEGYPLGQWVLIDYGDLVVHVFDGERRELYDLERLWSDAPEVTEEFVA